MIKNNYPGKFIVFEGTDGSGHSTQAGKLQDFLNDSRQKERFGHTGAHLTKEPTPSLIGGLIRSQLNHDWKSSPDCLQLLFCADRAYHLEKEIIPLLERGVIVIADRYFFSTVAFGALGVKDRGWLLDLNRNFLLPDLTILIKVSAKVCMERIYKSRYGVELFEKEESLAKVAENYEQLSREFENVSVINGERPIDQIHQEIIDVVCNKLSKIG